MIDPVELTADLIRCESVTPAEGGAIALMDRVLSEIGFTCTQSNDIFTCSSQLCGFISDSQSGGWFDVLNAV